MQLDTLTLCIVIALGGALIVSVGMMFRSWRDASRSAYYFHRKQSVSSMQSYALTSVVLGVLLIALTTFAKTPTTNSEPLIRVIRNAKPSAQLAAATTFSQQVIEQDVQDVVEVNADDATVVESFEPNTRAVALELAPAEAEIADREVEAQVVEAQVEESLTVSDAQPVDIVEDAPEIGVDVVEEGGPASIKEIVFSTQITDGYAPANPELVFDTGHYTMYATFQHENMSNGTTWAWEWTRDGAVVGSGNRTWVDNPDGHGYVYFNPTNGFSTGDYQLTIWVDGNMSDAGTMRISSNVAQ